MSICQEAMVESAAKLCLQPSQLFYAMSSTRAVAGAAIGTGAAIEDLSSFEVTFTVLKGPYDHMDKDYAGLADWVNRKDYRFSDALREAYVRWGEGIPPEEWITEVRFRIER